MERTRCERAFLLALKTKPGERIPEKVETGVRVGSRSLGLGVSVPEQTPQEHPRRGLPPGSFLQDISAHDQNTSSSP